MVLFEELDHPVRQRDEFKSIIVRVQAWPTLRVTIDLAARTAPRCVFGVKRRSIRSLITKGRFVLLLSPRCQLRRSGESADAVPSPDARQIVRIKRVASHLVLDDVLPAILVILATWA